MHPRTLLGVLDHIMSVEVDSNASVSFARQKGYGRTELEEESRERIGRIEGLTRLETIGTKGSNDASILSAPFLLPKRSFLRYNAARPSLSVLEARRIAENLLLLKRDKMVAPALRERRTTKKRKEQQRSRNNFTPKGYRADERRSRATLHLES
eukprot:scaffold20005_cov75-Skeletonema_dohrnii-CCMP3373.AAC.1